MTPREKPRKKPEIEQSIKPEEVVDLTPYIRCSEICALPLDDIIEHKTYFEKNSLSDVNIQAWLRLFSLKYNICKAKNSEIIVFRDYVYIRSDKLEEIEREIRRETGRKVEIERGSKVRICGKEYKVVDGDIDKLKRDLLRDICKHYTRKNLEDLFKRVNEKMNEIKRVIESNGYEVIGITAKTSSRLIIGTSEEMFGKFIFEVGLMWDPYMNLPYIPGSSLKGAFRAYLTLAKDEIKKSHGIEINDKIINDILGDLYHVSYIVFCDAYPVDCESTLLIPEVTTPIYHEQEGRISEVEAQPVPITYPAINKGVKFRIIIGIKKKEYVPEEYRKALDIIKSKLLSFIKDVLRWGIGAKTMLGYGILELDKHDNEDKV